MVGDELMKGVAGRLSQAVRTENTSAGVHPQRRGGRPGMDVVARIGGDEFVVLLEDFANTAEGIRVAERVQNVLKGAFVIDGQEIFITASIGIASSEDASDPEEILRGADTAMYKAKLLGRARYEVSDAMGSGLAGQAVPDGTGAEGGDRE